RRPTGQQFIKDRAQRVDVHGGRNLTRSARRLLGRHVGGRPPYGSGLGFCLAEKIIFLEPFRHAKIPDLGPEVRGQRPEVRYRGLTLTSGLGLLFSDLCYMKQDVARLEVAVQDATAMGVLDSIRQDSGQLSCLMWRRVWVFLEPCCQRD